MVACLVPQCDALEDSFIIAAAAIAFAIILTVVITYIQENILKRKV